MNNLPKKVIVRDDVFSDSLIDEISEELTNYLSNKYGYCVNSMGWSLEVKAKNINWDEED